MNICGITDIGLVRSENQDSYRIDRLDEDTALVVVCDGMGGARGGRVASSLAAEAFSQAVCAAWPGEDGGNALMQGAAEANGRVHDAAQSAEDLRGMGTTLVAALITREKIWVVNVGDSRCYRTEEGAIARVTRDHSLVEDLVARGEITEEQARVHPKKNLITRAVGVDRTVRADLYELENRGGNLLFCSDGLSNLMTDEELRAELAAERKDECCQRLLRCALHRGAPDNVTVVIVEL